MSTALPFRPRSVSELVDAAFQVLRRGYVQFVTIMGIAYIPWLIVTMVVTRTMVLGAGTTTSLGRGFAATMALGFGGLIWFSLIDGAMTVAASESYLGRPVDVGGAFQRALSRIGALIAVAVLRALAVTLGFVLFIVPGFYFLARYFGGPVVVMLEQRGAVDALGRSSELTRGVKGHVLKTLLLVWTIYIVLSIAVGAISGAFSAAAPGASPVALALSQIASAIFTILTYPIIAIVQTLLYYDLRIRKEGYDIELMAQELGGGGQQPAY